MTNQFIFKVTFIIGISLCLFGQTALAQQIPYINNINQKSATVNEQIVISGLNFSATASNWLVTFGSVSVDADESTISEITVTVPPGASTDNVVVTNKITGMQAFSNEVFYISYGGAANSFNNSKLGTLEKVASGGNGGTDICLCDFDLNGYPDIVMTHQVSTFISVVVNETSSVGNLNLTYDEGDVEQKIEIGFTTRNIACADMNGDQYPDIVVTSPDDVLGERLIVIENSANGTIAFEPLVSYDIPRVGGVPTGDRRQPSKVVINDIDNDGKPDVVVSIGSEGTVDIFNNNSSFPGAISLNSTPTLITVEGAAGLLGLDVKDLNNDGLADLGVIQLEDNDLFILQNISTPGSVLFKTAQIFDVSGRYYHLKFGDFDMDGFNDVAMTDRASSRVVILQNETSGIGEAIDFEDNGEIIDGVVEPWGLEIGDIEGDGDLDIITSSNNSSEQSLFVIENNGTFTGNLFDPVEAIDILESKSKHVKLVDLDGDARPDFVFSHRADFELNSEIGAILNQNCITPVISPMEDLAICNGQAVTFEATKSSLGIDYIWSDGSTNVQTDPSSSFTTTTGDKTYSVLINEIGCQISSNEVVVTIDAGLFQDPTIDPVGTICGGQDINFSATNGGETDIVSFSWSGPNDFSSAAQNPVISEATGANAGVYTLIMTSDDRGCISNPVTVNVPIINIPSISIINTDGNAYCSDGSSIDLSVTDVSNIGTYNYSWLLDDVAISPAESGLNYNVTTPGTYSVMITSTDGNSCTKTTASEIIEEVSPPVSSLVADMSRCTNSEMDFLATSTGQFGYTRVNNWDFGDGNTDIGTLVSHTYITENVFTASLNTTYVDVSNDNCIYLPATQDITVAAPPSGANLDVIRSQDESDPLNFNKCPSGFIRLELLNAPNDSTFWRLESLNYDSINESPYNEATYRIDEVDATIGETIYATVKDEIGCIYDTDPVTITNYAGSGVNITSTDAISEDPELGQVINMEDGQTFVSLSLNNGMDPIWSPGSIFNDSTLIDVTAYPVNAEESVMVTATDPLGCVESDSIVLISPPLRADKNFSPNGDGINDCWEVSNARGNACEIAIFDGKGRNIKQITTSPEDLNSDACLWDGTRDGNQQLPAGVYYYIVKCTGDNQVNKGGTILLAR
ncbi:MAG: VCBS repeat-containing protein [Reichenbachiella sp.]